MSARVFVDTNIWIYAKVTKPDSLKHQIALTFLRGNTDRIIISTQVVNEFYSVMIKNHIPENVIRESLEHLIPEVDLYTITLSTIKLSWRIREKYNYSIYDSLIIASDLEANCTILYSEDLQDKQLIEGRLRIFNPFTNPENI